MKMATAFTTNETIPIDQVIVTGNCASSEDDPIHFTGTIRINGHTTIDSNGGWHAHHQVNWENFKGVGQTSGHEYHLISVSTSHANLVSEDESPTQGTGSGTLILTDKTDGSRDKGRFTFQFTSNANGQVTVDNKSIRITCT